ncbi:CLUMA_CG008896, isoform A [Clunio marinus]|uniref:CLUMA_CG008896, isoform A n=1 Tax=Clunio marinus TaxID=568069 RepID=A0A1J1I503_9DIPT|nr:CLUMA_CG008896, isoform A [Clunio marinus]
MNENSTENIKENLSLGQCSLITLGIEYEKFLILLILVKKRGFLVCGFEFAWYREASNHR